MEIHNFITGNQYMKERKIGILLENRFIDHEIIYYSHRFPEENIKIDLLTRLWGCPSLKFKGLELGMEVTVDKSFEDINDYELANYSAIIIPAGYVADMLRYAEKPGDLAPAVKFIKRAMSMKTILKGAICHSLWIFDPIPDVIKGRTVTCHNNIIGSVKNTGAIYVDQDIVVDDDLITARTGGLFALFARTIINEINKRN
jgi:protease I